MKSVLAFCSLLMLVGFTACGDITKNFGWTSIGQSNTIAHQYGWVNIGNSNRVATFNSSVVVTGGIITNYTLLGTGYRAHMFTNNGTLIVTNGSVTCEYLVIAGGGGGAAINGGAGSGAGGGGAGGYRSSVIGERSGSNTTAEAALLLVTNSYSVIVGGGGAGGFGKNNGTLGTNSSITNIYFNTNPVSIISIGGGYGAWKTQPGGSGGSGGGSTNALPGYGTAGQGTSSITNSLIGGSAGTNGNGLVSLITGIAVTNATGAGVYVNTGDINGIPNTGNGGKGAETVDQAGNGGSGIVVIRYVWWQ